MMKSIDIKPRWHRLLAGVLSLAMILQLVAPFAAPQTAAADGVANGNGTFLQTYVATEQLNSYLGIAAPPTAYTQANQLNL